MVQRAKSEAKCRVESALCTHGRAHNRSWYIIQCSSENPDSCKSSIVAVSNEREFREEQDLRRLRQSKAPREVSSDAAVCTTDNVLYRALYASRLYVPVQSSSRNPLKPSTTHIIERTLFVPISRADLEISFRCL